MLSLRPALLRLAATMLAREWRSGDLTIFALALAIAVASLTTVGFFTDRVQRTLSAEANQMLGADLALIADHAIAAELRRGATEFGLSSTQTLSFPSMAAYAEQTQLVDVKAVGDRHPLRGKLTIADGIGFPPRAAAGVPGAGALWVAPRLLELFGIKIGDKVELGSALLQVQAVLIEEPDAALDYFNVAPRVLMNIDDVPRTGLIQVGSRATYRLLLAGEPSSVERYRGWAQSRLGRGERLEGVRDSRPEVRAMLEHAERFLNLAALLAVLISAVAVALTARRFAQRHLDSAAIMRCLGATQANILRLYFWQLLTLAVAGSAVGVLAGFGLQFGLSSALSGLTTARLALPSMLPVLQGFAIGAVLVLGFALPSILRLRQVPTLRVIRREIGTLERGSLLAYGVGFILLAALLFWKARDFKLGAYVIGGFGAALLVAMCAGGLLVWLVGQARGRARGPWRYGLANVNRRAAGSIVQIVALGLGIMALLLLTLVRGDLLRSWENKVPLDAPNRFVVSIQPDQVEPVKRFFDSHRLRQVELYPAVRGRLRAINGQPISSASFEDPRMKRLVEREFNLTSAKDLRVDNRVVAGNWRADASPPEFSMEEWIAQQLGVHIGDKVYFDVAGTSLGATVTSVRKVDWDSFKVNFYLIASPGALQGLPTSYLTSFYLPPGREGVLNALIRSFPNLTVIDVAQIMARFRAMTEQVAHAVQFVFVFTLGAGLIVLYAAINATQDERMFESAVMRAVGASRRQLMLTHLAEFGALGLAAGVLGAAGASAISFALSVKVFSFAYHFNPWILAWGALGGLFGVACAGLLGMRGTLTRAPLEIMRKFT